MLDWQRERFMAGRWVAGVRGRASRDTSDASAVEWFATPPTIPGSTLRCMGYDKAMTELPAWLAAAIADDARRAA
jgi:hypothetical protein